jgi:hypothetical protein
MSHHLSNSTKRVQRYQVSGKNRLACMGAANLTNCLSTSRWNIASDGQIRAVFGPCLTVLGGQGPGTLVSTRFCNGGPEQGWDTIS